MSTKELLNELLVRWEEEYDQGRDLSPQELCRDTPDLIERAAQEIAKLKRLRPGATVRGTPFPPTTQPMPPPPPALDVEAFAGLRFEPQRHHASGGLGHVFVAVDQEVGREVALKRIKPEYADEPGDRARFEREAEITGRLEHPGVVPLCGRDADGRPYYAMRFIRGRSLRGAIEEFYKSDKAKKDPGTRALAFRSLLQRFTAACNTMAYAHSRGVIHRDLKPDNIMLGPYGETLVVDWGLAKSVGPAATTRDPAEESVRPTALPDGEATQTGAAVGTPAFMSPEQALGHKEVGPASDVFSLGATLYQLLTSRPPYQGAMALVDAAAWKFPRPRQLRRDVPPALEAVCLKAMAFRPEDRYTTALELARDVDRWLADEPTAAYHEPWRVRAWRWVKRHRTPVAATAAALLAAALLVGGGLWWKADQDARAAAAAARQAEERDRDVLAALAETSRLEEEGQWQAAQAAAARAVGRLVGGPEDLRRRVRQTQADLNLEARIEELAVEVAEPRLEIGLREPTRTDRAGPLSKGSLMGSVTAVRDPARIDRDYAAALRDDGVPLDTTNPEEMAAWVRASAIREQLVEALDSWIYLKLNAKIDGAERLRETAQRADGNDWRRQLRVLSAHGDRAALEQLAGQTGMVEQPPSVLADLGRSLSQVGSTTVAVKTLRKAQQRYPSDLGINILLASLLDSTASSDEEVIGFLRAALAIRPGNPHLHGALGNVLAEQGNKPDEAAAAESQRAIDLDPKNALAHYNLGLVLAMQGKPDEAAAEFQRATDLDPENALAHYNLGVVLAMQGKFDQSISSLQRAIELLPLGDPRRPNWQASVSLAKRLLELDQKLPAVLRDESQASDAAECVKLAQLCQKFKRRYVAAARLYAEAFVQQPALADDLATKNRYDAACAAALAGVGQGDDASDSGDKERARLRNQALDWLRADLTAWDKRRQDDPKTRPEIQRELQGWQDDGDLAGVRDADALAKLPEAEREAWRKMWADMDALVEAEDRAAQAVETAGGKVTRDAKADGHPVVGVDLCEVGVRIRRHRDVQVTDAWLKELKEFRSLQTLDLSYTQVTDAGLKELTVFKSLQTLNLSDTHVTDDGLKELKELKSLQWLDLSNTRVTAAGLKELKELKSLQRQDLSGYGVTDAWLKELKELKSLQRLDLSGTWLLTDAGMKELKELKSLQTLDLHDTRMPLGHPDARMKELKELKSLQTLNLHGTQVTDDGLKELKGLQTLDLSGTHVTGEGLKELKSLRTLNLSDTLVKDAGLEELKELKSLQWLDLPWWTDGAGLKEVKKALPKCRIICEQPRP